MEVNKFSQIIFIVLASLIFPFPIPSVLSIGNDKVEEQGQGFFGTVQSFMSDLGKTVSLVKSEMDRLGRGIKTLEEFIDATVDEDCVFECPDGKPQKSNKNHVPKSNGCGSLGLEGYITEDMLPSSEFVACCDNHDLCYGFCGNDKDECDLKFKKCLYKTCSAKKDFVSKLKYKACQAGAKILSSGTFALGCKPYINAQREACLCNNLRDEF